MPMYHEYRDRAWDDRTTDEEDEAEETPSFMNEEPVEGVELLTDGGDE